MSKRTIVAGASSLSVVALLIATVAAGLQGHDLNTRIGFGILPMVALGMPLGLTTLVIMIRQEW
jgi:hypothetical protein